MNKKKLMIIPLLFVLGSCTYGSYSMVGGVKKTTNSEISASYKKFSGYFARKFKIKNAGEKYVFTFTCTTLEENEGTLSLEVKGDNSQTFNGLELLKEGQNSFNFEIKYQGEYEVKISGSSHSGSFSLTWIKE